MVGKVVTLSPELLSASLRFVLFFPPSWAAPLRDLV